MYTTIPRKMKRIAIFASGSGSNAENFVHHFRRSASAEIALILTDNPQALVLERAARLSVPSAVFSRSELREGKVLEILEKNNIDFVVLAGFLSLVPASITRRFERRMVNIHPALLPAYGGKGMYGMNVHRAVIQAGEQVSGITIHYVDEHYDQGSIIFQAETRIEPGDTPEKLAERVHALEYEHFPQVVDKLVAEL